MVIMAMVHTRSSDSGSSEKVGFRFGGVPFRTPPATKYILDKKNTEGGGGVRPTSDFGARRSPIWDSVGDDVQIS